MFGNMLQGIMKLLKSLSASWVDELILDSFRQWGYFDFDGGIDKLHLQLFDTINDTEVLYKFVKNVNAFIDEMKSIGDDEVEARKS